jgi:hypothetical protein
MPHSRPIALHPLPYALGIIPSFCVNAQKTLVMKEKVWALAQDSFHIRDENNVDVLQCKAKLFSLHHQKFFSDMQGNELWSLKHKPLSIPRQYYAERPDGQQVFHVQGHWHCLSTPLFSLLLTSIPYISYTTFPIFLLGYLFSLQRPRLWSKR